MKLNTIKATLIKHAPTILVGVGVASILGGTALTVRATMKTQEIVTKSKESLNTIREDILTSEEDKATAIASVRKTAYIESAKVIAPAAILTIGGVAMVVKGSLIYKARIAGLTAAYTTLQLQYNKLRSYVEETHGENGKEAIAHIESGASIGVVDKKGKTYVTAYDANAVIIGENATFYQKDPVQFYADIQMRENMLNKILQLQGYIFVNEVRAKLGLPDIPEGQVTGWIYDRTEGGDGHIDFGIKATLEALRQDNDGQLREQLFGQAAVLNLNHDGVIIEKLNQNNVNKTKAILEQCGSNNL